MQGPHSELAGIEFIGIANTAVDDDATPTLILAQLSQLATNQRAPNAGTGIDHQHSAMPRLLEGRSNQRIIIRQTQCDGRTAEPDARAKAKPSRGRDLQPSVGQAVFILIAQIGGCEHPGL